MTGAVDESCMETPLLSAALIVKNEEKNLPGCLRSLEQLRPLLADVNVYDTGSDDQTVALARAAGATVVEGYWDGDFARAHNEAVSLCRSKWVLNIDADERIVADTVGLRRSLREALVSNVTGLDALNVTLCDIDSRGVRGATWQYLRVFRPSRAHYEGAVHEQVRPLRHGQELKFAAVPFDVLRIEHHGYADHRRVAQKLVRNLEIASVAADNFRGDSQSVEQHIRALVDKARSLMALGAPDEALPIYQQVRNMESSFTYRWWGMQQMADMLVGMGRTGEAQGVVQQLRAEGSSAEFCDWLQARILVAEGKSAEALKFLRESGEVTSAVGSIVRASERLAVRLRAEIDVGNFDEAAACAIALIGNHAQVEYLGLLLKVWKQRPLQDLVDLLLVCGTEHLLRTAEEAQGLPAPGPEFADRLRQAVSRATPGQVQR